MKKRLGLFLLATSLFLAGCSLPFGLGQKSTPTPSPTPEVQILTPEKAPYTRLTLTADKQTGVISGHTLTLSLMNLDARAQVLEYLLLYDLPDGRQQGVPGKIDLTGQSSITRDDLLMGTCSKTCRFDEGVTKGTIELTYRDGSGATLGDIIGDWHLQNGDKILTSVDDSFEYAMLSRPSGWFVTESNLGLPAAMSGKLVAGPFVVTGSGSVALSGTATFKLTQPVTGLKFYLWDGKSWQELTNNLKVDGQNVSVSSPSLGTFVVISS